MPLSSIFYYIFLIFLSLHHYYSLTHCNSLTYYYIITVLYCVLLWLIITSLLCLIIFHFSIISSTVPHYISFLYYFFYCAITIFRNSFIWLVLLCLLLCCIIIHSIGSSINYCAISCYICQTFCSFCFSWGLRCLYTFLMLH